MDEEEEKSDSEPEDEDLAALAKWIEEHPDPLQFLDDFFAPDEARKAINQAVSN